MSGRNKSVGFAVLSIVLVLTAGLVVSGCGGGAAPKPGKVYKVTFEASGGEPVPETQFVEAGNKIELPKTMARTKFTFSGWYKDLDCKEPWDFARDTVESDIILFANWKSTTGKSGGGGSSSGGSGPSGGGGTTYFTVTFDSNGGTLVGANSKSVANGASVGAGMTSATNAPELFFGWNTIADGTGNPFTSKTAVTGNITVYAMWAPPIDRDGSTQPKAFLVSTPDALKLAGKPTLEYPDWDLEKFYELNDDIDMSLVTDFKSIGEIGNGFKGTFDGNGHIIKDLTINAGPPGSVGEGMFGVVDSSAVVTGVTLENCFLDCSNDLVAGMVGRNNGTVEYCNVSGTIIGNANVGGVVGFNFGIVRNCYATASVTGIPGSYNVGGVVGYNISGMVENCYATGEIAGYGRVGGVVGFNEATVQNCYATGKVTAADTSVGGVVASNNSGVENCVALNTSVTLTLVVPNIGRVVGYNDISATLTNNYAWDNLSPSGGGGWSKDEGDDKVDGADVALSVATGTWWRDTANFPPGDWDFTGQLPTLK